MRLRVWQLLKLRLSLFLSRVRIKISLSVRWDDEHLIRLIFGLQLVRQKKIYCCCCCCRKHDEKSNSAKRKKKQLIDQQSRATESFLVAERKLSYLYRKIIPLQEITINCIRIPTCKYEKCIGLLWGIEMATSFRWTRISYIIRSRDPVRWNFSIKFWSKLQWARVNFKAAILWINFSCHITTKKTKRR